MAVQQQGTRTTWQIDPVHSVLEVSARHMMVTTVKGRFSGLKGTIVLDQQNPANSSVDAEVDAKTIETGVEQRNTHMRSADFLDVDKYPTITFKSTRVEPQGTDRAKVYGNLSLHGVTKEIVFDTELTGFGKNPQGVEVAGLEARTTINRKDFGLHWNVPLEGGGVLVSDNFRIEINVQARKQP